MPTPNVWRNAHQPAQIITLICRNEPEEESIQEALYGPVDFDGKPDSKVNAQQEVGKREDSIASLPDELLLQIFNYFRNDRAIKHFLPCLHVCQRWNRVRASVAWSPQLSLTNATLGPFAKAKANHAFLCFMLVQTNKDTLARFVQASL